MYLPRDIDRALAGWYASNGRKPLVLRGARQTGKSTYVRHFAPQTPCFVELNLERFEDLRLTQVHRLLMPGHRLMSNLRVLVKLQGQETERKSNILSQ